MNVKMLETYQGVGHSAVLLHEGMTVTILEEGESYKVDTTLGKWLIENGKAQEVSADEPHYGGQPFEKDTEPKLRHDDEIYEELTKAVTDENDIEQPAADPVMNTKSQATSKPKRGRK